MAVTWGDMGRADRTTYIQWGEGREKAWYSRCVVIATQCMTTSATGEIQKYSFGHSLCECIMYWDSPDLYLRSVSDPHQAVHEKLPV